MSSIENETCNCKAGGQSPIEMVPKLFNILVPNPQAKAINVHQTIATDSPWVHVTVHLDALLFSNRSGCKRPPNGPYYATYQLPGMEAACSATPAANSATI